MTGEKILIVDDEENIIQLSRLYLEREGYNVVEAGDGEAALAQVAAEKPALIVLDIMLPKLDGFDVCRSIRLDSDVPIIMLTARDDDIDKIVGLELGADDYLTKPFNPRELVARVKAILRRAQGQIPASEKVIRLGDVSIDPARREVLVGGKSVSTRAKEFDLLLTLAEHRGMVLRREKLLELVWGYDFYGQTRTVDVHVAHLRKRLAESQSVRIETVTGIGYKLVA